jgi:dolichol-phosphate mannosyltransferase
MTSLGDAIPGPRTCASDTACEIRRALAVPVVIVALLLPLVVLLLIVDGRHHPRRSWVHPPPRELIRRALVVIPAHPDAEALQRAIDRALHTDPRLDVLVVDTLADGSAGITTVAPRVTLLRRPTRCTQADALRLGAARGLQQHYDAVVELSVEHSRLARSITSLLEALDDGAHVAIGSRYVPGGRVLECGAVRRLVSRGVNVALRWYTRLPQHDVAARIRAYRRVAVEQALLRAAGHRGDVGLDVLLRCRQAGLHVAEVPVTVAGAVSATDLAEGRHLLGLAVGWRRSAPVEGDIQRVIDLTDPAATSTAH